MSIVDPGLLTKGVSKLVRLDLQITKFPHTIVLEWELSSVYALTNAILYVKRGRHRSLGNCILNICIYYYHGSTTEETCIEEKCEHMYYMLMCNTY